MRPGDLEDVRGTTEPRVRRGFWDISCPDPGHPDDLYIYPQPVLNPQLEHV